MVIEQLKGSCSESCCQSWNRAPVLSLQSTLPRPAAQPQTSPYPAFISGSAAGVNTEMEQNPAFTPFSLLAVFPARVRRSYTVHTSCSA